MTNDIAFIEKMFYEYKKLEDRFLESEVGMSEFKTGKERNPFYTGIMDNEPMFCVDSDGFVVYKKPSEQMKGEQG